MWTLIAAIISLFLGTGAAFAQHHAQHLYGPEKPICADQEKRLSFRGYKHCEYHNLYQASFKNWNCQCYSGQCRPTEFRVAAVTPSNPVGYEVQINGAWFPIPENALRKERANMSFELLQWMAHVCANDPVFEKDTWRVISPPHIECVWINTNS